MNYEQILVDMADQGADAISARTGVPIDAVKRHLQEHGLGPGSRRMDLDAEDIPGLYQGGMTIAEIAEYLSCSLDTVSRRLTEAGVNLDKNGRIRAAAVERQDALWPEIENRLDQGGSPTKLSREYSIEYLNFLDMMRRHGYPWNYEGLDDRLEKRIAACRKATDPDKQAKKTEGFIEKARVVHGDKYDYSRVEYVNNKTKVAIVCPVHGVFLQTPDKHVRGQGCPHPDCIKIRIEATNRERYGVARPMQAEMVKKRARLSSRIKYGSDNPMKLPDSNDDFICTECRNNMEPLSVLAVRQKIVDTKRERGTFHTSSSEDHLYDMLCNRFGTEDVVRQYQSDAYPWACDFYIKSRSLYIELNATWTHGGHWYVPETDEILLGTYQERAASSRYYANAVHVWTVLDVQKRQAARDGQLNYVVFWDSDLSDARQWFEVGCPDGRDWEQEYSWM